MFLLFLLLVLGTLLFFLVRNGQLGSTAWAPSRSPDKRRIHGACQCLELDSGKRFLGPQKRQKAPLNSGLRQQPPATPTCQRPWSPGRPWTLTSRYWVEPDKLTRTIQQGRPGRGTIWRA